jgi:hypothetical protein
MMRKNVTVKKPLGKDHHFGGKGNKKNRMRMPSKALSKLLDA